MPEPRSDLRSRRALLAGAAAAVATTVGMVLGRVPGVAANDGEMVILGQENVSASPTKLRSVAAGPVLMGDAPGPGIGVMGRTSDGIGIYGTSRRGKGIVAQTERGTALEVSTIAGMSVHVKRGRIKLDGISGTALMEPNESSVTVSPSVQVVGSAFVLLTPKDDLAGRSLWYSTQPEDSTITIHLDDPLDREVRIAWLMLG